MLPAEGAQASGLRQPLNACPGCAVAVSVTTVPAMKFAEHIGPEQFIPPTLPITLPLPGGPATTIVRVNIGLKIALTNCAPLMISVQLPIPEQAPLLHPANAKPLAGAADSVTLVPALKVAVQVAAEQLIPAGLLVTVPEPVTFTVSEKVTTPKVAVTEPPRRALGLSNTTLLLTGITSVSDFKFAHGAFIDVIQVLFSKVFAPAADRLRISKPKGAFSGTLFDTSMGGLPAITFPRNTLRTAAATIRMPVTFPVMTLSSMKLSVAPARRPTPKLGPAART